MHAITLKIFILTLNIENIIKYESYYFLRVLTFLQLYFARGPLIGPWVLLVWGRDCPPKCWLVAWIATQPIGRSGSRARHGGPFLVSHWLLSLPRQLAVAREFRPNGVPRLLLMTVHSQKKRFHRAPFCYKMVLERSAPARVHVIGTFDKTKVPDANLQLGLRCPPSRGAGGEPKIVLTGDHTQNLRTIVSNFSSF